MTLMTFMLKEGRPWKQVIQKQRYSDSGNP